MAVPANPDALTLLALDAIPRGPASTPDGQPRTFGSAAGSSGLGDLLGGGDVGGGLEALIVTTIRRELEAEPGGPVSALIAAVAEHVAQSYLPAVIRSFQHNGWKPPASAGSAGVGTRVEQRLADAYFDDFGSEDDDPFGDGLAVDDAGDDLADLLAT